MDTAGLYLPDECWELILKFLINHDENNYSLASISSGRHIPVPSYCHFKSLSVVSKQLLSITNRLRFSLTIFNHAHPFSISLFYRFTNLTSLDLSCYYGDLNYLLYEISRFPLSITSLNLSRKPAIPVNGLRSFSENITTLTSLSCSGMKVIYSSDLFHIADCLPLLEELDLSDPVDLGDIVYWNSVHNFNSGLETLSLSLFKLRKVNLFGHYYISDQSLFHLFKNCKLLEEAIISFNSLTMAGIDSALRERPYLRSLSFSDSCPLSRARISDSLLSLKGLTCLDLSYFKISDEFLSSIAMEGLPLTRLVLKHCIGYSYDGIFCLLSKCQRFQHLNLHNANFLNDQHVVQLSSFLGDLMSINLSRCPNLTKSALFALTPLSKIIMEYTSIGRISVENSNSSTDFIVSPRLKSLSLAHNQWLRDDNITMIASISPNLEFLDVSYCIHISGKSICQVLRRCCKIRHLNLANCSRVKLIRMNFKVPKLEVLNLSYTMIDDETLYVISKNCCGLLQLLLSNCYDLTKKGVKHVLQNCTQLREINLKGCYQVNADVVASMVFSRPSLRKIKFSFHFRPSYKKRKYLFRHGCLVD